VSPQSLQNDITTEIGEMKVEKNQTVPHAIATSGSKGSAAPALHALLLSEILTPRQASSVATYAAGQVQSPARSQPSVIVMRRRVCEENRGNARPLR
jgi:hypothetical protein